jgi:hypothetical protein
MNKLFGKLFWTSVVIAFTACSTPPPLPTRTFQDTRTYHNVEAGININAGMNRAQVINIIGSQPFARDFRGTREVLQWCRTIPGNNDKYLLITFDNGLVSGVSTRSWSAKYDCVDTPAKINWESAPGEVKEIRIR